MKKRFTLYDIVSFVYIAWVIIIVGLYYQKVNFWYWYILGYIAYFFYILIITKLYQKNPENKLISFFRITYPIITMLANYRTISGFVTVIYGRFIDEYVIHFQQIIFGTQPVLFLEGFVSPVMTELMKFCYFSYYFYMPVVVLILFFKNRYKDLEYFVFMVTFIFYICYIGFVLYPIEGPRYTLAHLFHIKELQGFIITPLHNFVMGSLQTIGACMPSSHVAAAWSILFLVKKFFGKKPFFILFPVIIIISIAVVYNRYHYLMDSLMGMLVTLIFYPIGKKLYLAYNKN